MIRLAFTAALLFTALPAQAREPSPAQQAQHQRMRSCNADARTRELRGDPRKSFMRQCLRRRSEPTPSVVN